MSRRRWYVVAALAAVTALVVLLDLAGFIFEPDAEPADTLTLDLPRVADVEPALPSAGTIPPNGSRALVRALLRALDDDALGSQVTSYVAAVGGEVLVSEDAQVPGTPASTLKLLTGLAALDRLGADARFATTVVTDGAGGLVLVGGGDATLATEKPARGDPSAASLAVLARRTAAALRADGVARVRLGYDSSLFTGPSVEPSWEDTYVTSGVIAPVTALMADQGLVEPDSGSFAREPDPAAAAAEAFADLLADEGIRVHGTAEEVVAPADVEPVAEVLSPATDVLVERMLTESDNQLAEALARLAAAASGLPASFEGGADTIVDVASERGADLSGAAVLDGSGLSRDDLVAPIAVGTVLAVAAADPALRPLTEGLPVAALTGTLADRFLEPPAEVGAGVVRAKTGTLTGVSAEAGLVLTCDGNLLVFAFVADQVPFDTESARLALDEAAATLAACG